VQRIGERKSEENSGLGMKVKKVGGRVTPAPPEDQDLQKIDFTQILPFTTRNMTIFTR